MTCNKDCLGMCVSNLGHTDSGHREPHQREYGDCEGWKCTEHIEQSAKMNTDPKQWPKMTGIEKDLLDALYDAKEQRARADRLEAVLRDIARPRYGLQGIVEDGNDPEKRAEYFSDVVEQLQSAARATLKEKP